MAVRRKAVSATIAITAVAGATSLVALSVGSASVAPSGGAKSVTLSGGMAAAGAMTFTPVADTYVDQSTSGRNYGTSGLLSVDGSPVKRAFLKFKVSGFTGTVSSARLRVHTDTAGSAASGNGGSVRSTTVTTWSETGMKWSNQPAINGVSLGSFGAVASNSWYELDVSRYVKGNGTYSFAVTSTSGDGADFDSRETGSTAPRLVIDNGGPSDPVLVGAGDIATSSSGDTATAALLDKIPGTVFTVGDNAYNQGTAAEFAKFYEPTWGRHKARTRPIPGNHEYKTAGASGYYAYFGSAAGDPAKGYYSYDLGSWHVVALNSNCAAVGGCGAGSAQEQWLRADLAASTKQCTAAYWHHPRWTSGLNHGPDTAVGPLLQALYDNNAEVVVTGHNHHYERFAPMSPAGTLDNARGIRQFVAGMGGAPLYGFGVIRPNSEARNKDTFGVLKLTLHAGGYDWTFVPQAGKTYSDAGSATCH